MYLDDCGLELFVIDLDNYNSDTQVLTFFFVCGFPGGGGGANGEMANLTNEKGKFAIAIFRHFSPLFAIFRHW